MAPGGLVVTGAELVIVGMTAVLVGCVGVLLAFWAQDYKEERRKDEEDR